MENLHLIVGLGNPGSEYARTRHNAGFLVVERLAERWQAAWTLEKKFSARLARTERDGRKLVLCEPQTFMNCSGEAAGAVRDFYRVPPEQVLVVVDDADLPFGSVRLRPEGSSGGHHGLDSIEQHLGTRAYPRLRIGIGRTADGARQISNYVLAPFGSDDAGLLAKVLDHAARQVEIWLSDGIQKAMNQFNGPVDRPEQ
jgi:PTH1 family peptidyl-tRNA hydrolase